MKPEMILQSDLLDIVFENRNKEYGAYALRKDYPQHLRYSLSGLLFALLIGVTLFFWSSNRPRPDTLFTPPLINDTLKPVTIPPDEPQPKPQTVTPPAPPRMIKDVTPRIVPDIEVTEPLPTIEDRDSALAGDRNVAGPPANTQVIVPQNTGSGTGDPAPEQPVVVEPDVLEEAEVRPEFPGGTAAWLRFLQKNLRFPNEDKQDEAGRKIVVTVKFIVNEDGTLSGLEILQTGGKDFDKEVIRVLNKSPKWMAGSNKGKKVKVYHKQPVIFVYEADE